MRKILITMWVVVSCALANSQTLAEWTQQKKTQIEYLLDQIAANKVYLEYVEKGYEISKTGLNTIQDIKSGDFKLHSDLFRSLEIVNPDIRGYARVADIITTQVRIVKVISTTTKNLGASGQFKVTELDQIKLVFENILEECLENIDELYLVITGSESGSDCYRMTDDERIKRIDQIYAEMQCKYSFCRAYSGECSVLAMQRLNEVLEIEVGKKINDVK